MQNTNMIRIREEPLPPNTFLGRRTDKITAAKPPSARSRSGNAPHALSPDFGVMSTEELLQHLATSSTSDGSFSMWFPATGSSLSCPTKTSTT